MRLDYKHAYHAGSYADVVKHVVLISLLEKMRLKATPYTFVDTHAGAGAYDLSSAESLRLAEHRRGIDALLSAESLPPAAERLAGLVDRTYPGSPKIAAAMARPGDSLVLVEKSAEVAAVLRDAVPSASVVVDDGYEILGHRRGGRALVFCDPPYQLGGDTERAVRLIRDLHAHWRAARFALWYPVRARTRDKTRRLHDAVRRLRDAEPSLGDCLAAQLALEDGTLGTGFVLVKPPFGFDAHLEALFADLAPVLQPPGTTSHSLVTWL